MYLPRFLSETIPSIHHHHEHFDGNGYPDGLKSDAIPLGARIIAVVDSYDVMTNERHYHNKKTTDEALAEIQRCSGTQFDPGVVETFTENFETIILRNDTDRILKEIPDGN